MSWGISEFAGEKNYNGTFTTPAGHQGITFVAASGDNGSWLGASFPAVSPNVLGVGGTQLSVSGDGTYQGETAWSASGGGSSRLLAEPGYQKSAQGTGARTSPDVSWDASVSSGVSVYSSSSDKGAGGWFSVGGTSAGTPAWAAIVAVADQGRAVNGQGSIAGAQSLLYSLPTSDFHDVTSGRNGAYSAGNGYDLVTGLGSPIADRLVAGLVSATSTSTTGNFVVAGGVKVKHLSRLRVKRHDEFSTGSTSSDPTSTGTVLATGSASDSTGSANPIQVTTISPNQAIIVELVSSNGTVVEVFIVPLPSLDVAALTHIQPISPITAGLLLSPNPQPDVERVGQGDDPELPATATIPLSDESPLPSVIDYLDSRMRGKGPRPGPDIRDGIPADLAPQDPPAPPPRQKAPLPPTSNGGLEDAITLFENGPDLDWAADRVVIEHFAAVARRDLGMASADSAADGRIEKEGSWDGPHMAVAAAVALGGARLLRARALRNRPETANARRLANRRRGPRSARTGPDPFRYLLQHSRD